MNLIRKITGIFKTKKWFRNSFKGAEAGRLLWDWIISPITIDEEIKKDKRRLTNRARDLANNDSTTRNFRIQLISNVLGPQGIRLQAQARNNDQKLDKGVNRKIESAWNEWANDVSVDGRFDFLQFQQLALKTVATDGEVFVRKLMNFPNKFGYALQLIDPDLVDHEYNVPRGTNQNEIRLGVEINEWGRPLAYWVYTKHPNEPLAAERKRIRISANEILHLYIPERINQTRGTTWLNSVMMSLRMLDGYCESELVASRTSAAKMGWLQYKDANAFDPPDPNNPTRIEASPGTVDTLPPGMEFVPWNPDHPATAFPDFIKSVLRKIATGLGVSYNALANDLEGVNYSSLRSGLLVERELWKILQQWWINSFLQKIYPEWLQTALLSGRLVLDSKDFGRFLDVKWQPRGWAWVDPLKDVQASILAITNGLESRTGVLAEKGEDFEEILERLTEEKRMTEESGLSFSNSIIPESKPIPAKASEESVKPKEHPKKKTQTKSGDNGNGKMKALNRLKDVKL